MEELKNALYNNKHNINMKIVNEYLEKMDYFKMLDYNCSYILG